MAGIYIKECANSWFRIKKIIMLKSLKYLPCSGGTLGCRSITGAEPGGVSKN